MGCCNNTNEMKQSDSESQAVCPVMGGAVDKKEAEENGLVREYKGKKYYFCCGGCPEMFEKNPEEYISK